MGNTPDLPARPKGVDTEAMRKVVDWHSLNWRDMKNGKLFIQVILSLSLTVFFILAVDAIFDSRDYSIQQTVFFGSWGSALLAIWLPSRAVERRLAAGTAGVATAVFMGLIVMELIAQWKASSWPPALGSSLVGTFVFIGDAASVGLTFAILRKSSKPQSNVEWSRIYSTKSVRALIALTILWFSAVFIWGAIVDWTQKLEPDQYATLLVGPPALLVAAAALFRWVRAGK